MAEHLAQSHDGDLGDHRRGLEQEALRNVRSLVDRLDKIDRAGRKRDLVVVCAIVVLAGAILGTIGFAMRKPAYDPDDQRQRACELDAFNTRAADFERSTRDANPGMLYRDIQKRLERERPTLVAAAKTQCRSKDG
jgi:hypothetical protein